MNPQIILYPLLAMFVLVNLVLLRLGVLRLTAVKSRAVSIGFYKTFRGDDESEKLVATSRNLANLFEMPVLFYLAIVLIFLTKHVDMTSLALAWSYVGLRAIHTLIHVTFNHIRLRFAVYALSNFILIVLWLNLFVRYLF